MIRQTQNATRKIKGAVAKVGDKVRIRDPHWVIQPLWQHLIGQCGFVERITHQIGQPKREWHGYVYRLSLSPRKARQYWIKIGDVLHGPYPAAAIEKVKETNYVHQDR